MQDQEGELGLSTDESGRVLATLLSNLPGMAYRCRNDHRWTMIFASEGARPLTGYGAEELCDNRVRAYGDLLLDEDRTAVWAEVQEALAARRPFQLTYRIRTASGEIRWVWEQGRAIHGPEGEILYLEGFVTDITARIVAEGALRRSEEELRHARQMEALGRLAGGVAHDFNNLLTAITGHAESLLRELPSDSPLRSHVSVILRTADRGAALAVRLLARGGAQNRLHAEVDLHHALRDLRYLLEALTGPAVRVELDLAEGPALVTGDRLQLEQVLMNLALNSRDAMPQGGLLRIRTERVELAEPPAHLAPGPFLRVQVEDTGLGMAVDVQQRVFEPFFTTKDVGRGSGLGLFSAYGIVQQHRGHISVASSPGRGTVFTLLLPLGEAVAAAAPEPPPKGGSETILLVEDEDLLRDLARESLGRQGYRVLDASDGRLALDLVGGHPGPIDLLITDVVMPRIDGVELAETLTKQRPELRVLFITGYMNQARGLTNAPHRALLEKPFRAEALLRRVRELLDT